MESFKRWNWMMVMSPENLLMRVSTRATSWRPSALATGADAIGCDDLDL